MFGSFLPSLLVGFSTTHLTRAGEPTLLWNHYTNNQIRPKWSCEKLLNDALRTSDEPSRPTRQISGRVPEWNAALYPLSPEVGNLYPRQLAQRRSSQNLTVRPCIRQSRLYPFRDQRSLKLGNRSDHLEHEFTRWQRCIDGLGHGNKIDSEGSAHLESRHELFQRASKAVEFPNDEDIDGSPSTSFHQFVQRGPVRTGPRDTLVPVDLLQLPPATLDVLS